MKYFKIVQLSDLHGNTSFIDSMRGLIESADLVVLSGDITHFGGKRQAEEIVGALLKLNGCVAAVAGNCDRPGVREYLKETGVSVDGVIREVNGFHLCGMGGSLPGPVVMPYQLTDDELAGRLERLLAEDDRPDIAVIHQPPFGSSLDLVSSGKHVGSNAVRDFIERSGISICLTGHIHESIGTDVIGHATVVNPGPARHGHYAVIEIKERSVSVELKSKAE